MSITARRRDILYVRCSTVRYTTPGTSRSNGKTCEGCTRRAPPENSSELAPAGWRCARFTYDPREFFTSAGPSATRNTRYRVAVIAPIGGICLHTVVSRGGVSTKRFARSYAHATFPRGRVNSDRCGHGRGRNVSIGNRRRANERS